MKSMLRTFRPGIGGIALLAMLTFLSADVARAHKNQTQLAVGFSANPVAAGTPVTITGTLTYTGTFSPGNDSGHDTGNPANGDPVVGETVQIQQKRFEGVAVPCSAEGAFVEIASGNTDAAGRFPTLFDTTGLGGSTIGFRAHHPDGGGAHGAAQSSSPCVDLVIEEVTCTEGVEIAADLASGDGTPPPGEDSGPWTFRIKVTACETVSGVFAQGGTNGWAPMTAFDPSAGAVDVRYNKRNQVLRWTIGDMVLGQMETLDVTVDGAIKNNQCGKTLFLSGPWSATSSDDGGATFEKSDYTGRVTIDVTCP